MSNTPTSSNEVHRIQKDQEAYEARNLHHPLGYRNVKVQNAKQMIPEFYVAYGLNANHFMNL